MNFGRFAIEGGSRAPHAAHLACCGSSLLRSARRRQNPCEWARSERERLYKESVART
jgi:hypothetical protein